MSENGACPECRAHTGQKRAVRDLDKKTEDCRNTMLDLYGKVEQCQDRITKGYNKLQEEKVSMRLFYILICCLITLFGGIFLLHLDTNNDVGELISAQSALAENVKHLSKNLEP